MRLMDTQFVYPFSILLTMEKDVGLRIRVQRELRDEFVELCRLHGRPASSVLREFMERYIAEHVQRLQPDLFSGQGGN